MKSSLPGQGVTLACTRCVCTISHYLINTLPPRLKSYCIKLDTQFIIKCYVMCFKICQTQFGIDSEIEIQNMICIFNRRYSLTLIFYKSSTTQNTTIQTVWFRARGARFNTLRPRQNCCHFGNHTFKRIFCNEMLEFCLKFY